MSGAIIPTPAFQAADGQSFGTQVEKQRLSFIALSLTNYDNNSIPQIAAGSCIEICGSIFQFASNDDIGGSPTTANINYIMLEVSGSGDSQTVAGTWTTTAPTWSDAKQGWYDATVLKRYVGGCYYVDTPVYNHKFLFDKGRNISREFELEIGDWNMNTINTKDVAHSLGAAWKKIRSIMVIIRNDTDDIYHKLEHSSITTSTSDSVKEFGSTNITLQRFINGIFDNDTHDSTSYNRGWITVKWKII